MNGPDLSKASASEPLAIRFTVFETGTSPQLGSAGRVWPPVSHPHALPPLSAWSRVRDAFFAAVRESSQRPAVVTSFRTWSYRELGHYALCVADHLLSDADYRPGDRVAVMLDNGPDFIAAYYGILAAGGVVVPLPANIEWCRLERIVGICDIRQVLSSACTVARRPEITSACCRSIELGRPRSPAVPDVPPHFVNDQSLAMIMFTSGSSGDPKGVMLSDRNLLANTQSILEYLPITRADRALALLPFYHAFGHSIMQTHLLSGATLVVDGNMLFPNSVVDALERHGATSFSAVPEGYYSLLSLSDLRERKLPYLRYMSVAGGALKPDSVVAMAQCLEPAEFYVMYGQTEASARLAYLPPHLARTRPDSIGTAIPGVELCVLDQNGREVQAGVTGELCARGANVMLGYWNDPQGTGSVMRDGWLRTGDLASRDRDGYFYVQARKNELVKIQGYRVHPREVEDTVARFFPALRIVVVPYQQHNTTRLALYGITGSADHRIVEELRSVCHRELPRHKAPTFVEVLTQAPLNASMKLDRVALKRRAELHSELGTQEDAGGAARKRSA